MEPRVADNPGRSCFEVFDDDELAGFAEYHRYQDEIAFIHTEIDPRFEGRGLGGVLARAALDAAREQGLGVLPSAPSSVAGSASTRSTPTWCRRGSGRGSGCKAAVPETEESADRTPGTRVVHGETPIVPALERSARHNPYRSPPPQKGCSRHE